MKRYLRIPTDSCRESGSSSQRMSGSVWVDLERSRQRACVWRACLVMYVAVEKYPSEAV